MVNARAASAAGDDISSYVAALARLCKAGVLGVVGRDISLEDLMLNHSREKSNLCLAALQWAAQDRIGAILTLTPFSSHCCSMMDSLDLKRRYLGQLHVARLLLAMGQQDDAALLLAALHHGKGCTGRNIYSRPRVLCTVCFQMAYSSETTMTERGRFCCVDRHTWTKSPRGLDVGEASKVMWNGKDTDLQEVLDILRRNLALLKRLRKNTGGVSDGASSAGCHAKTRKSKTRCIWKNVSRTPSTLMRSMMRCGGPA